VRRILLVAPVAWLCLFVYLVQAALANSGAPPASGPAAGHPPALPEFRGVYLTSWSAASRARIEDVVRMARAGWINTVVIDVKDATGSVAFPAKVEQVRSAQALRLLVPRMDDLVARLHREGLYVIARIVVFCDPKLAEARPELAVHSATRLEKAGGQPGTQTLWRDRMGLAWIDPAAREAWQYNAVIAREALALGFDEVNFDYIRFPSDGALRDMVFPVWRGRQSRSEVIREFLTYLRGQLGDATLSADLFGLTTVNRDDLGVGQVLEDALVPFDYVCPMVYPSHYAPGFIGKPNPAEYPYEVVFYSMRSARERLQALGSRARARLRPWLQDFDLGADYTPERVLEQVRATQEALGPTYTGFLLWNPRNRYTEAALASLPPVGRLLAELWKKPPLPAPPACCRQPVQ